VVPKGYGGPKGNTLGIFQILFYLEILMKTYTGRIAKRLEQADLNFSKQCLGCTGKHIPPTFRDGIMPIDAVYATAGIECVNAYILPHKGGIGDHRCFIIDFSSSSVIGTRFQNIVRCAARRLHCTRAVA